jgi:hypothetical protein
MIEQSISLSSLLTLAALDAHAADKAARTVTTQVVQTTKYLKWKLPSPAHAAGAVHRHTGSAQTLKD